MIELDQVTLHYGVQPVLRNVSLTVRAGEIVALMGPNGMGKSTLVGVAAGLLWPMRGEVRIDGIVRRSSEANELAIRQRVAYLAAEPWLPTQRKVREWILAVGRLYGVEELRLVDHVERLLDVFDLTERADVAIAACSTGQRKKTALCCLFASEAPILMLDEPFAGGLDPSGILALKRILQHHAAHRDRTVLIATPVPELVEEVAGRVALIAHGEVTASGTPAELREQSKSATLAEAYERLTGSKTLEKIHRYFAEGTR